MILNTPLLISSTTAPVALETLKTLAVLSVTTLKRSGHQVGQEVMDLFWKFIIDQLFENRKKAYLQDDSFLPSIFLYSIFVQRIYKKRLPTVQRTGNQEYFKLRLNDFANM